jgi:hypothetical protein
MQAGCTTESTVEEGADRFTLGTTLAIPKQYKCFLSTLCCTRQPAYMPTSTQCAKSPSLSQHACLSSCHRLPPGPAPRRPARSSTVPTKLSRCVPKAHLVVDQTKMVPLRPCLPKHCRHWMLAWVPQSHRHPPTTHTHMYIYLLTAWQSAPTPSESRHEPRRSKTYDVNPLQPVGHVRGRVRPEFLQ